MTFEALSVGKARTNEGKRRERLCEEDEINSGEELIKTAEVKCRGQDMTLCKQTLTALWSISLFGVKRRKAGHITETRTRVGFLLLL